MIQVNTFCLHSQKYVYPMGANLFLIYFTMSCCENNNEKQDSCSSGNNNCCNGKSLIVFLLIVSIVANLGTGYYLTMNNSQSGSTD